jgi:HNH endonuclease
MQWDKKTIPEPNSGCIIWLGAMTDHGYGRAEIDGKYVAVHRLRWETKKGKIPAGMYVLHHCDNRLCCNINHLFLGTHTDNMRDMVKKGRWRKPVVKKSRYQGKEVVKGSGALAWLASRLD